MANGYEALRRGAAWLDVSDRGRLLARGRDRARFLHNVTSNEVKKLAPGSGCYAFLLTPQGRIQADVNLFCFSDHFLLDTEPELREKVPALILRYKVADQVEIEDVTAATSALALEGPAAAAALAAAKAPVPGEPCAHLPWGEAVVAGVSLTGQPGFRIFAPAAAKSDLIRLLEAAGAHPATLADARLVRIENGKPRYGEDIRETSLPQETQQMQAVSFQKGCYLGQEIVERIRAQGHVNKKLVRLALDSAQPVEPGTRLSADGKEAGEVTSSAYSPDARGVAALAYVRTPYANPGSVLQAGEISARVL
ncbi:MAG TPA: glycine cleavage T C-terminal barrel domain-containing protein [Bryobacteraceae bacterium]|nr:glycine cleavage T C-terminal barrel domain-containing protein [Bryobacteraceae bacterium]